MFHHWLITTNLHQTTLERSSQYHRDYLRMKMRQMENSLCLSKFSFCPNVFKRYLLKIRPNAKSVERVVQLGESYVQGKPMKFWFALSCKLIVNIIPLHEFHSTFLHKVAHTMPSPVESIAHLSYCTLQIIKYYIQINKN